MHRVVKHATNFLNHLVFLYHKNFPYSGFRDVKFILRVYFTNCPKFTHGSSECTVRGLNNIRTNDPVYDFKRSLGNLELKNVSLRFNNPYPLFLFPSHVLEKQIRLPSVATYGTKTRLKMHGTKETFPD